jgi:hypothetical protein
MQIPISKPISLPFWNLLVLTYSKDPTQLEATAIGVSEISESIASRRRDETTKKVTLAIFPNANYWILTDGDSSWLVPKANFRISGPNFDTLQALFCVHGQQSHRLKLIKPAFVEECSQGWKLIEKGEIQFC